MSGSGHSLWPVRGPRVAKTDDPSDGEDLDPTGQRLSDRPEVVWIGGEHTEPVAVGNGDQVDVDNVGRARTAGVRADVVRLIAGEGNDLAPAEETSELCLATGPAHLGHDGRRRHWCDAELEAGPMIGPYLAV